MFKAEECLKNGWIGISGLWMDKTSDIFRQHFQTVVVQIPDIEADAVPVNFEIT